MDIGNKIKQLRMKMGLTQEHLATRLGISAQSVSKWENSVTMPDITLLPVLSSELGVSIDELFDMTADQKLHRIEKRLDVEEEFSQETFREYEDFLKNQLEGGEDLARRYGLLARLYHHRATADLRRVSRYAREAICKDPAKKECQWLLQKADGAYVWDWNVSHHTAVIDFYKRLIESDPVAAVTNIPYYELMDNLIADHRTEEAKRYLSVYQTLSGYQPFLIPVYHAYIALAEYHAEEADAVMEEALKDYSGHSGFLFEMAQYCARRCQYEKAIGYYERSWASDEKLPRYTDTLHAISIIYEILGQYEKAIETYERMLVCLTQEWHYQRDDAVMIETKREISRLQSLRSK